MIKNIQIKNIRGYGPDAKVLPVTLSCKKINILIAPNGFGKTSIATAFKSLSKNGIKLKDEDRHLKKGELVPSISLEKDGICYEANSNINTIDNVLKSVVVDSGLKAKSTLRRMGSFSTSSARLVIEDVVLFSSIPIVVDKPYKYTSINNMVCPGRRFLKNLSQLFDNVRFLLTSSALVDVLMKFTQKNRNDIVNNTMQNVLSVTDGARKEIRNISDYVFTDIESDSCYKDICKDLSMYDDEQTPFSRFELFYQLFSVVSSNKKLFKNYVKRIEYEAFRNNVQESIKLLNSSWKNLNASEHDGKLILSFSDAGDYSSGQRDLLSFVAKMMKIKAGLDVSKNSLVIIDEIFDYLDDANLMAAQFYLMELMKEFKNSVYLVILTHLSPEYFRNYVFNSRRVKFQFLQDVVLSSSLNSKAFISYREQLPDGNELKDALSCYFFHFHPLDVDYSAKIPDLNHLKISWGNSAVFKEYLNSQMQLYLSDDCSYDPYAVCICLRRQIEQLVYDALPTGESKETFIRIHKTDEKLSWAEDVGYVVPDAFYMLSILHNDACHLKDENGEKACVYKLNHPLIKNVIRGVFDNK